MTFRVLWTWEGEDGNATAAFMGGSKGTACPDSSREARFLPRSCGAAHDDPRNSAGASRSRPTRQWASGANPTCGSPGGALPPPYRSAPSPAGIYTEPLSDGGLTRARRDSGGHSDRSGPATDARIDSPAAVGGHTGGPAGLVAVGAETAGKVADGPGPSGRVRVF